MRHRRSPILEPSLAAALALTQFTAPAAAQEGGLASFLDQVEVRVLSVDVVVLDATGNRWRGLAREDFELFENGEPVEISNFAAYDESYAPADPTAAESALAALAGVGTTTPLQPPPVTWVVYVDQSRLDVGPRNQVLRETREFLEGARKPDELAMISTWDGQRLRVVSQLSTDGRAMSSALADLQKEVGPSALTRARSAQLEREIQVVGAASVGGEPADGTAATTLTEEMARSLREEVALNSDEEGRATTRAIGGFQDLLEWIDGIEGRVVLLFAGGGYDLDPGDALAELWTTRFEGPATDSVTVGSGLRASQLSLDYLRLLQSVNRSRVTVHTIFAGASRGLDISADNPSSPTTFGAVSSAGGAAGAASSLSAFAAETGGRIFTGNSKLAERLDAVRRDLGLYYSLGYHPQGEPRGGLRQLEVRVRREGAQVRHRNAVVERSAEERAEAAAVAVLIRPETRKPAGALIEPGPPRDAEGRRGRVVPVRIAVPLREIVLLPDGAKHLGKLVFHFALATPDGGFLRFEPRRLDFEIPNEDLSRAVASSVSYEIQLPLDPGSYRLGVAVQDELAGTHSTLVTPIDMPRAR